jgi:hypothetical protein
MNLHKILTDLKHNTNKPFGDYGKIHQEVAKAIGTKYFNVISDGGTVNCGRPNGVQFRDDLHYQLRNFYEPTWECYVVYFQNHTFLTFAQWSDGEKQVARRIGLSNFEYWSIDGACWKPAGNNTLDFVKDMEYRLKSSYILPRELWNCVVELDTQLAHLDDVLNAHVGAMRTFGTGATRNTDVNKLDYEGFLSPTVLKRYAEYLHKHRVQADGNIRESDNWQKGIPKDVYMKSAFRHFMDVWSCHRGVGNADLEESLCATLFNLMGYLHEVLKGDSK